MRLDVVVFVEEDDLFVGLNHVNFEEKVLEQLKKTDYYADRIYEYLNSQYKDDILDLCSNFQNAPYWTFLKILPHERPTLNFHETREGKKGQFAYDVPCRFDDDKFMYYLKLQKEFEENER